MIKDYRHRIRRKGIEPIVIQRTDKKSGDWVLRSWVKPVERVQ